ncbi:uncharacterized GPI-anchored protein At3g06035-like [Tripterygium wilfordii]|uniref:uncharacterized GPI-anchored protein At3g06035-like n=1 Tax=Tripterygium wilfordii TaxID=458696 RepID=UPI0018F81DCE|nr:uncharacterized GPI-anchored protein At3g06035-like [Tripterygium wilfordii]
MANAGYMNGMLAKRPLLEKLSPLSIFFLSVVVCAYADDALLQGIDTYRTSLNLTTLIKSDSADCLADEVADQFKNQPCTNTTSAHTVPGTEPRLSNYRTLLAKCHLNVSNTRDGNVMPAYVPNLMPSLVLFNFTQSLETTENEYTNEGYRFGQEEAVAAHLTCKLVKASCLALRSISGNRIQ